jgi:integral membrane protein
MMTKLFKFIAIAEGISYIVLFFNMLVIKRLSLQLYKLLLYPIGMAHGLLFISYVTIALIIWKNQKWTIKEFLIVQLGSLIPFGTFYVEKKYLRNA